MVTARGLRWRLVFLRPGIRPPMLFLLLVLLLAAAPLVSPDSYEGKRISAVSFDPTDQPLLPAELQQRVKLTVGQPLHLADVREAIANLYSTGRYRDIAVDAQSAGDGVAIKFVTTGSQFIREVTVTGVPEPPNAGQLVAATKLQLGYPYSESQVRRAVESL